MEVMANAISAIAESAPVQEMGAELSRLGTQGAAELASALFSGGNAYVAYGDGQSVEAPQIDVGSPAQEVQAPEVKAVEPPQQERGGMEM